MPGNAICLCLLLWFQAKPTKTRLVRQGEAEPDMAAGSAAPVASAAASPSFG